MDDYSPRELSLMHERDAALRRAEIAESKLAVQLDARGDAQACRCGHTMDRHDVCSGGYQAACRYPCDCLGWRSP